MTYPSYEPSTYGWNALRYRRRELRRRVAAFVVGGVTVLLAGAIAGVLTVGPARAMQFMR